MNENSLLQLLLSPAHKLLCTQEEFVAAIISCFPVATEKGLAEPLTYRDSVKKELQAVSRQSEISVTDDFGSDTLDPDSLAYHRIKGMILSDARYGFSTKQFAEDLLTADANPRISCHFLHITSGGGEAWYLDRVSEILRTLDKPVYTLIEKVCASAAYYIGCHGMQVKAVTQNDTIGSIGTMVSFYDIRPYLESLGLKYIEEYASKSRLKNKKFNDLADGDPEQFIREELDPLQVQFEAEVRRSRSALAALDPEHPVFLGESFDAVRSVENGLIDGIVTMPEAMNEAYGLGREWSRKNKMRHQAYSFI
ncbi:MAG: S49 family peptidase [Tannerella sp.]|jgi:possible protease|nr:S49 family peptidase [Tannerella sp.]DAW68827.1 MAG TPA: hypothetical protein [Bacteriophage sp.]